MQNNFLRIIFKSMWLTVLAIEVFIWAFNSMANSISFSNFMHWCTYSYWDRLVLGARYSSKPQTLKQYLSTLTVPSSSREQATLRITCSTVQNTAKKNLLRIFDIYFWVKFVLNFFIILLELENLFRVFKFSMNHQQILFLFWLITNKIKN